ncbi:MAG TPA: DinB family protein [Dehalococcoidia bacterium]|nr:DinB family protein [Dehalococcoidia bacterium]
MTRTGDLAVFYEEWAKYQGLLVDVIKPLTDEQLQLRPAPHQWAVWQIAGHMAACRPWWFGFLGEGSQQLRDMFRVEETTVPDLPVEHAWWEDNENRPRTAKELVDAHEKTWAMIDGCLRRWTPEDLEDEFSKTSWRTGETEAFTRGWVLIHLMGHDFHHGGEISNILGSHGLKTIDDF